MFQDSFAVGEFQSQMDGLLSQDSTYQGDRSGFYQSGQSQAGGQFSQPYWAESIRLNNAFAMQRRGSDWEGSFRPIFLRPTNNNINKKSLTAQNGKTRLGDWVTVLCVHSRKVIIVVVVVVVKEGVTMVNKQTNKTTTNKFIAVRRFQTENPFQWWDQMVWMDSLEINSLWQRLYKGHRNIEENDIKVYNRE